MDDTIFWSPNDTTIDQTISELKSLAFDLVDERAVDSFLGIEIDTAEAGTINMTQPALTQTSIYTLGLEKDSKQHQTPTSSPPLQNYEDYEAFDES